MAGQGFKHDLKYYINLFDYLTLRRSLKIFLQSDPNADSCGEYNIRSLYFDDLGNSGLYEKLGGFKNRSKYRIRIYNRSDRLIKLEKKINDMIRKDVKVISKSDFQRIVRGDVAFLKHEQESLLLEFYQKPQRAIEAQSNRRLSQRRLCPAGGQGSHYF